MKVAITKTVVMSFAGLALLAACKNTNTDNYAKNDPIIKNIDSTVKPGDDFFQYANGKWLKENPIPAAYSSWGIFNEVQERNRAVLRGILEGLRDGPGGGLG